EPAIPLGRTGQLDGVLWQIVGFQHRLGTEPDDPDEHFGWEEYLLYNCRRGFCFLVDSTDGWSLVKPTTGAPTPSRDMLTATYLGTTYQQQFAYSAQTTFVEGEFYWPVQRGQRTANRDYAKGDALLSMEQNAQERTWSIGRKIASDKVADAFALKDKKELLRRGDSGPTTPGGLGTGSGCGSIMLFIVVLLILFALLKSCDDDASNSGRSGYFPGSSGGGGGFHK
ncbi:MAG: putative transrane protein, partial [Ramlibacter sp.]|nr:putative transrane protein [Ramlibacter sp.]